MTDAWMSDSSTHDADTNVVRDPRLACGPTGTPFSIRSLGDLLNSSEAEPEWLLDNLLIAGGTSLLVAKPKVGKSTFARALAVAVARGEDFVGRRTGRGPVLYLALEEHAAHLRTRFVGLDASEEDLISVHVGPPGPAAVEALPDAIRSCGARLAIVDPLQKLIRASDLNDYAKVTRALEPLAIAARDTDCHILAVHHSTKGERDGADSVLGSTALFAGVDALLTIRNKNNRLSLEVIQRYSAGDPDLPITIDHAAGTVFANEQVRDNEVQERKNQLRERLIRVIREQGPIGQKELREAIGGNQNHTSRVLGDLFDDGTIGREGTGRKGSPFIYFLLENASEDA